MMKRSSISAYRCLAIISSMTILTCGRPTEDGNSRLKETQPYQANLVCELSAQGSLQGRLYAAGPSGKSLLSRFNQGHVGNCELAKRSSRNGVVCIETDYKYRAIKIETKETLGSFGSNFEACLAYTKNWQPLATREGYAQFIDSAELANTLKYLPQVSDPQINAALHGPDTMWYDEETMVFAYQDSFGNPTGPEGLRANRVGYDVGINSTVPGIRLLTEYFEPTRFKFPFSIAAGGTERSDTYVINFWAPPRDATGKVLPVVWWKSSSHWNWVFPVGTMIGEVLMLRDPAAAQVWYVFEIRSRMRELDGWKTDVFRPFTSAGEMAQAVKAARPQWQASDLSGLVTHLESPATLTPAQLSSKPYAAVFPTINGFYDFIPETSDKALIKEFLTTRTFQSAMGKSWKTDGNKITYAAATKGSFQIVPSGFIGGMLRTSEDACMSCHTQTARPLRQLRAEIELYGEIWGDDQIFTWHPFKPSKDIFTVSDGSRMENPRLVQAGLLQQRKPGPDETLYRELPRPYIPDYRNR